MENPIAQYRRENNLTWGAMAEKMGVSQSALSLLLRVDAKQMGSIHLATVIRIKKNLGIDLVDFVTKNS